MCARRRPVGCCRRPAINVIRIVRFGCTGPDHDGPINHKRLTISRAGARAYFAHFCVYIIYVTRISIYCYYVCVRMTLCALYTIIIWVRICRDFADGACIAMMIIIIIRAGRRPSPRRPLSPTAACATRTSPPPPPPPPRPTPRRPYSCGCSALCNAGTLNVWSR